MLGGFTSLSARVLVKLCTKPWQQPLFFSGGANLSQNILIFVSSCLLFLLNRIGLQIFSQHGCLLFIQVTRS